MLEGVSIVIPAAAEEPELSALLDDLKGVEAEIIVSREGTRARSLNAGAAKAGGAFLWFLHADSRVRCEALTLLDKSLREHPDSLHYFDLAFDEDALPLIRLNGWGANMRSRLFGVPFGDQGFCVSRSVFNSIGGFPEGLSYGEDLMFVWRARRRGIGLRRVAAQLRTSARAYRVHGWFKLTLLYQWRWIALSLPEVWKLVRRR